jgi:hypothetical protein
MNFATGFDVYNPPEVTVMDKSPPSAFKLTMAEAPLPPPPENSSVGVSKKHPAYVKDPI